MTLLDLYPLVGLLLACAFFFLLSDHHNSRMDVAVAPLIAIILVVAWPVVIACYVYSLARGSK